MTPAEAAGLYRGFLADCVRGLPGCDAFCYVWPASGCGLVRSIVDATVEVRPQRGDGLWARMAGCLDELLAEGYEKVVLRNTDSPDLPAELIGRAFAECGAGRVVLGPDTGGGYYLIGVSELPTDLLGVAPEGGATVMDATVTRAQELGVDVVALPVQRDVDAFDDLLALWRARQGGDA